MKVFVPVTDEMLDSGDLDGLLVPYRPGRVLLSQCRDAPQMVQSRCSANLSPATNPNSEALPALSSSTYMAGPALG